MADNGTEEAPLDRGFNFIYQLVTILGIMPVVMLQVAKLSHIFSRIRLHLLGPLRKLSFFDFHKNISLEGVKRCVPFEPPRRLHLLEPLHKLPLHLSWASYKVCLGRPQLTYFFPSC